MTENVYELSQRDPDRVLRIIRNEMRDKLWTAEEMWKEGVDEVVPDMVAMRDKLEGLNDLIRNWETIEKRDKMIQEVI